MNLFFGLGDKHAKLYVDNEVVGDVSLYIDGFKFCLNNYVINCFAPSKVELIRQFGNNEATLRNITKRLIGKP